MADLGAMFTQQFDAARVALSRGDQEAAAESLRAAVVVARSTPALKRELASALLQLGKLSEKLGRAGEAEQLLTEALAISERLFGMEHPALGPLLNELSRLHIAQSHHTRAEAALERLLGIVRAKGEEHAEVATALAGLAFVKRRVGDDASAETLYRDALRIREKVLAPNHMVTVVTLEQLSETCAALGKLPEALALLQRALPTREAALGADHATVGTLRSRIAALEPRVIAATTAARAQPKHGSPSSAPPSNPNELVFLYKPEPRVRRSVPVPVPRARAKTPRATAAVAAASFVGSPIEIVPTAPPAPLAQSAGAAASTKPKRTSSAVQSAAAARISVARPAADIVSPRKSVQAPASVKRSPKKRTVLYASAGVAAVAIAIGGLTFGSSGGGSDPVSTGGSDPVPTKVSAQPRTTAVAAVTMARAARADSAPSVSATSVSATPTPTAPLVQAEQRAPERATPPSLPRVPVVPTTLRALSIPTITTANVDSLARSSTKLGRESLTDRIGTGVRVQTSSNVDDGIVRPRLIQPAPLAHFPDELRSTHPEGEVIVRFAVDENGRVDVASMTVVKSDHKLFTAAVRDILPRVRFEPARSPAPESKPVADWVSFSVQFNAKN